MRRFFAVLTLVAPLAALPSVEAKEVRVYSGRHYNTDRVAYKKFSEQTGIKVRLIEATGISLVERLKREGTNSNADVILLVMQQGLTTLQKLVFYSRSPLKNSRRMFLYVIGIHQISGLVSRDALEPLF